MSYVKSLFKFRDELWEKFESIVKSGAKFPTLIDVKYPYGINPPGMMKTTEGRSTFLSKEIIANPGYIMHIGEDIIVATGDVEFIDTENKSHIIEPDITDVYWLCLLIDDAIIKK